MRLALYLALVLAAVGCRRAASVVVAQPLPRPPVVLEMPPPPEVAPAPIVAPGPVQPPPCPLPVILFAFDSAELTPEALEQLGALAACPGPLTLSGHADERGTEEYNLHLSQRRADAVRLRLVALGFAAPLLTRALGEAYPAALGSGEAAWARNRRVEVSR